MGYGTFVKNATVTFHVLKMAPLPILIQPHQYQTAPIHLIRSTRFMTVAVVASVVVVTIMVQIAVVMEGLRLRYGHRNFLLSSKILP
jgi:hypothetical protein